MSWFLRSSRCRHPRPRRPWTRHPLPRRRQAEASRPRGRPLPSCGSAPSQPWSQAPRSGADGISSARTEPHAQPQETAHVAHVRYALQLRLLGEAGVLEPRRRRRRRIESPKARAGHKSAAEKNRGTQTSRKPQAARTGGRRKENCAYRAARATARDGARSARTLRLTASAPWRGGGA